MAFGKFLKGLFGSEPAPSVWAGVDDEDLDRLWRAQDALTPAERLKVRDEIFKRDRWFTFTEVGLPYVPSLTGLDALFRREGLASFLRGMDAHSREPGVARPFQSGALVECGPGRFVAFVFPVWRGDPGPIPDADLAAVVVMGEGPVAASPEGVPRVELDALTEEGQTFDGLTVVANDTHVEATDEDGTRVLLGMAIPAEALLGDPLASDVIGSLAEPDDDDTERFNEAGWDMSSSIGVEQVTHLTLASGGHGNTARNIASGLRVPCHYAGRGTPLTGQAQTLVTALKTPDADLATVLVDAPEVLIDEVLPWLTIDGDLDALGRLLSAAPGRPVVDVYRGFHAQLTGDTTAAREAYEAAATAEEPHGLAMAQLAWLDAQAGDLQKAAKGMGRASELAESDPAVDANHALLQWRLADKDEAFGIAQATQLSAVTWLGSLVEATVMDGDPAATALLGFDPIGYAHAPIGSAICYLQGGDFAEAERLMRRGLALCPDHPSTVGNLALHLARCGRTAEARALCDETLERAPHFNFLRSVRAALAFEAGELEKAAFDLRHNLQSAPDQLYWRMNLIKTLVASGEVQEAFNELEELEAETQLIEDVRRRLKQG